MTDVELATRTWVLDQLGDSTGDYSPPENGIPISDLDSGVQASLALANTALQPGDVEGEISVPEATTDTQGVVRLSGVLGGTADNVTFSPTTMVRRVVLYNYVTSSYPARPADAPAGTVEYLGPVEPSSWLELDVWIDAS